LASALNDTYLIPSSVGHAADKTGVPHAIGVGVHGDICGVESHM